MSVDLSEVGKFLLSGAFGSVLVLLINGYRTVRETNDRGRKNIITHWRDLLYQAEHELEENKAAAEAAASRADHWRKRAGDLEYLLRTNGIDVPKEIPDVDRDTIGVVEVKK